MFSREAFQKFSADIEFYVMTRGGGGGGGGGVMTLLAQGGKLGVLQMVMCDAKF